MTRLPTLSLALDEATSIWTPSLTIPCIEPYQYGSPAVASAAGSLYVVYLDRDQKLQWIRKADGQWGCSELIPGNYGASASMPALASCQEGLLLVSSCDNQIYSSVFANDKWKPLLPARDSTGPFSTSTTPAIVSLHSCMLMVWTDQATTYYSLFNGKAWTGKKRVCIRVDGTPALVFLEYDDKAVMTWTDGSGCIKSAEYSTEEDRWREGSTVLGPHNTYAAPIMTLYYERPLMVWKDAVKHSFRMWFSFYNGRSWEDPAPIPCGDIQPETQPTLAHLGDEIYLVWKKNDAGELSYSSAKSTGGTYCFGQDPGSIAFGLSRNTRVLRTFIQQGGISYARGRLSRPQQSQKDLVLSIGNESSSPSINSIEACYEVDGDEHQLPCVLADPAAKQWCVTLRKALLGTGGTIHVRVRWDDSPAMRYFSDKGDPGEDPVIVVNVSN
ncbi:MAG TPA: hypothetical protein VNA24_04035 [Hyalangium sp.]|nr:hypothetical protein [Hyalangium sp.]